MLKKVFFAPAVLLCALAFFCLPAFAAEKAVTLADFNGVWKLDAEKSKNSTKAAADKLKDLTGLQFKVDAKAKTIRMEWPKSEARTRKVAAATADGQTLSCKLEGYKAPMLLEKVSKDEIRVKDREEALVFVRVVK